MLIRNEKKKDLCRFVVSRGQEHHTRIKTCGCHIDINGDRMVIKPDCPLCDVCFSFVPERPIKAT
jgi:hypothetical protein